MGLFAKIKEGLKKTRENVSTSIEKMLHSFQKIDDELFEVSGMFAQRLKDLYDIEG